MQGITICAFLCCLMLCCALLNTCQIVSLTLSPLEQQEKKGLNLATLPPLTLWKSHVDMLLGFAASGLVAAMRPSSSHCVCILFCMAVAVTCMTALEFCLGFVSYPRPGLHLIGQPVARLPACCCHRLGPPTVIYAICVAMSVSGCGTSVFCKYDGSCSLKE